MATKKNPCKLAPKGYRKGRIYKRKGIYRKVGAKRREIKSTAAAYKSFMKKRRNAENGRRS